MSYFLSPEEVFGQDGLLVRSGSTFRQPQLDYANNVYALSCLPYVDRTNVLINIAEAGIGKTKGYGYSAVDCVLNKEKSCVISFSTNKLRNQAEQELKNFCSILNLNVHIIKTESQWDYYSLNRVTARYNEITQSYTHSDVDKALITAIYNQVVEAYKTGFGADIYDRNLGFECDLTANDLCLCGDDESHPFKFKSAFDPKHASIVLTTHAMLLKNFRFKQLHEKIGLVIIDECQEIISVAEGFNNNSKINLAYLQDDLKAYNAPKNILALIRKIIRQLRAKMDDDNKIFDSESFGKTFDTVELDLGNLREAIFDWLSDLSGVAYDLFDNYAYRLDNYLSIYCSNDRYYRKITKTSMHVELDDNVFVERNRRDIILKAVCNYPARLLSWLWLGKYKVSHVVLTTAFLVQKKEEIKTAYGVINTHIKEYREQVYLYDKPYVIEKFQTITNYGTLTFSVMRTTGPLPFISVDSPVGYIRNPQHIDEVVTSINQSTNNIILVLCNSYSDIELLKYKLNGIVFAQTANDNGKYRTDFINCLSSRKVMLSIEWAGLDIPGWQELNIVRLPILPKDNAKSVNFRTFSNEGVYKRSRRHRAIEKNYQGIGRAIRAASDKCRVNIFDPRMPIEQTHNNYSDFYDSIPYRFRDGTMSATYSKAKIKVI